MPSAVAVGEEHLRVSCYVVVRVDDHRRALLQKGVQSRGLLWQPQENVASRRLLRCGVQNVLCWSAGSGFVGGANHTAYFLRCYWHAVEKKAVRRKWQLCDAKDCSIRGAFYVEKGVNPEVNYSFCSLLLTFRS